MTTITIAEGITLTATAATCDRISRELEEARREWEDRCKLNEYGRKLVAMGINPSCDDFFSDWHKDIHGYRPRWDIEYWEWWYTYVSRA